MPSPCSTHAVPSPFLPPTLSPIPFLRFVGNLRIFLLALLALEKGLTKKSTIIIMFLQFAANQRIFFWRF